MKKSNIVKNNFINYELLDLYSDQFSIDSFKDNIKVKSNESNEIINTVVKAASNKEGDDVKLIVNLSDEMKEAYKNGDIKLDTNKNGEMYAQIRKNGKYGKKLSISEEVNDNGLSNSDIAFAMEINAIKEQLNEMIDALKDIETYVIEVVHGLHNDRIGLFYSGLSTYMEASQVTDVSLKNLLISQSIKSINDSQAQVMQEFKNDVKYLLNHEYENNKNQKRHKIIKEKMDNIHICFETIYRATMLKAMIYFDIKQLPAMFMSLEEYGRFIEQIVKPNASKLVEFDNREDKLINTIWEKRAKSFKDCVNIKNSLLGTNTYYITMEDE